MNCGWATICSNGTFNLGQTLVTNFRYLSISNAVLQMAVINPNVPCITVTNLNLGDAGAASTINITTSVLLPAQFPLIKYGSVTGTFCVHLGTVAAGYCGRLVSITRPIIRLICCYRECPAAFGTEGEQRGGQ